MNLKLAYSTDNWRPEWWGLEKCCQRIKELGGRYVELTTATGYNLLSVAISRLKSLSVGAASCAYFQPCRMHGAMWPFAICGGRAHSWSARCDAREKPNGSASRVSPGNRA